MPIIKVTGAAKNALERNRLPKSSPRKYTKNLTGLFKMEVDEEVKAELDRIQKETGMSYSLIILTVSQLDQKGKS